MRALIIEDSEALLASMTVALRSEGYAVDASGDGRDGLWRVRSSSYDCVILDIMLPTLDGLSIVRELRDAGDATPILLITARDAVEDRVVGLDCGADDYLVKPFALVELLARVRSLVRRRYRQSQPVLRSGTLVLDTSARTATCDEVALHLTAREYAVLEYLLRRAGDVVSRTEIEGHIYDENAEVFSNVIDTVVYSLRKKLAEHRDAPQIVTRRGMGYSLEQP